MARSMVVTDVEGEHTPTVAILGAGISGICLGIQLKKAGIDSFTIFEKSDGVGGTWRDNVYPGAACDAPSFLYSFSFEPKTDWTRKFSPQPEILAYLEHCVDKYDLRPHLRLRTEVASARFDVDEGVWRIRTTNGREHVADVLVSGVGQLNRPAYPDIPGRERFGGKSLHSARWDRSHDTTGQSVAVIGNGASAIQIVPQLARKTMRLYVFQRSANWMLPRRDRAYSPLHKLAMAKVPGLARLYRMWIWGQLEWRWPVFSKDSRMGRRVAAVASREMARHIRDPRLRRALTPDYPVGCKRLLISDDYYPALARDNVEVVTEPIREIDEHAVVTDDGRSRQIDTIVYATGFQSLDFLAPMDIYGANGRTLNEAWRDGAEAYLGLAVPGFPNFFMLYGPNTNLGHNSIIFMIECQVRYVLECISELAARNLKFLDVRADVARAYNRDVQSSLKRSVWDAGCKSWYKTDSGKITNNWPHTTISFWWRTRRVDLRAFRMIEHTRQPLPRLASAA